MYIYLMELKGLLLYLGQCNESKENPRKKGERNTLKTVVFLSVSFLPK